MHHSLFPSVRGLTSCRLSQLFLRIHVLGLSFPGYREGYHHERNTLLYCSTEHTDNIKAQSETEFTSGTQLEHAVEQHKVERRSLPEQFEKALKTLQVPGDRNSQDQGIFQVPVCTGL